MPGKAYVSKLEKGRGAVRRCGQWVSNLRPISTLHASDVQGVGTLHSQPGEVRGGQTGCGTDTAYQAKQLRKSVGTKKWAFKLGKKTKRRLVMGSNCTTMNQSSGKGSALAGRRGGCGHGRLPPQPAPEEAAQEGAGGVAPLQAQFGQLLPRARGWHWRPFHGPHQGCQGGRCPPHPTQTHLLSPPLSFSRAYILP